jgi:glutamate racemase
MIGVFDSGYGGLAVLRKLVEALPQYSYLYLGDNAREPYGPHSPEEIYGFTRQGVEFLFAQGCPLVILACNTASAGALRRLQTEVLPARWSDRRVLGVLAPTVEMLTGVPWEQTGARVLPYDHHEVVGVLATQATVSSGAYRREIEKRSQRFVVIEQACPLLTSLIAAARPAPQIRAAVRQYLGELGERIKIVGATGLDSVILGCTHYALIQDLIASELPPNVRLYEQGGIVALALQDYLRRHPDLARRVGAENQVRFLTTGDPAAVSRLGSIFFGKDVQFEPVTINR